MQVIDWLIVAMLLLFVTVFGFFAKKYNKGVADFLAAGRCGGRYILAIAELMAVLGAISFVADFELKYNAGFSPTFWSMLTGPVSIIVILSGWVIYRFRQTRALTLAQFLEVRYSRRFRIFTGTICYISGIVNFGIFPGIGSRFFVYFCGLPATTSIMGVEIATYIILMVVLLTLSLLITFWGGQITIMVTDFLQGAILMISLIVITLFLLNKFGMNAIFETISNRSEGSSFVNPYDTGKSSFNLFWYLAMLFSTYYGYMNWQSVQGYNTSAKNPHEARMSKIVGVFRGWSYSGVIIIAALAAYTAMHHPSYSALAADIRAALIHLPNAALQEQMATPIFLGKVLPLGLRGLFCGIIFCSFIATHDTFMHSWGSILVQDVLMPFRKKPLTPKQHMRWLRLSIAGVALFAFLWSTFLNFQEHINMYWMITSSIFLAGSGAVVIGGLYWKRGTTAGAYSAMIVGGLIAIAGFIARAVDPEFPVNAPMLVFISSLAAIFSYISVSLIQWKDVFNLDQMLHRGKYSVEGEIIEVDSNLPVWKKRLGITEEFTKGDKFIYFLTIANSLFWFVCGIGVSIYYYYCKKNGIAFGESQWFKFWKFQFYVVLGGSVLTTIWITTGGIFDIRYLFKTLAKAKRSEVDDGWVEGHHSKVDEEALKELKGELK